MPTTTVVAQPFNIIKWQLKFNPVAYRLRILPALIELFKGAGGGALLFEMQGLAKEVAEPKVVFM